MEKASRCLKRLKSIRVKYFDCRCSRHCRRFQLHLQRVGVVKMIIILVTLLHDGSYVEHCMKKPAVKISRWFVAISPFCRSHCLDEIIILVTLLHDGSYVEHCMKKPAVKISRWFVAISPFCRSHCLDELPFRLGNKQIRTSLSVAF